MTFRDKGNMQRHLGNPLHQKNVRTKYPECTRNPEKYMQPAIIQTPAKLGVYIKSINREVKKSIVGNKAQKQRKQMTPEELEIEAEILELECEEVEREMAEAN